MLADGTVLDVTTVIWCTGFEHHFEWIDLPVFDQEGWPREYRGVVDEAPGLFFCGLVFQYAFSSMVLPGVGRDAAHVAGRIANRSRTPEPDRRLIPMSRPIRPIAIVNSGDDARWAWSTTCARRGRPTSDANGSRRTGPCRAWTTTRPHCW